MRTLILALLIIAPNAQAKSPKKHLYTDSDVSQYQAEAAMECISEDAPKKRDGKHAEARYVARVQACLEKTLENKN